MLSAHEFAAKNHAVRTLVAAAYNLNPRAIAGGPAWVDSDHWDIVAKTPGDTRPNLDEQMSMLRKLLADRFELTFHREPKQMRVFALDVTKGGPKLRPSDPSAAPPPAGNPPLIFIVAPATISLPARNATMAEFASVLQRAVLDYPVLDRTGLSGRYDFDLAFSPDETVFGGALGNGAPDSPQLNFYAAIQSQLGLKLETTTGTVDTLVIDRVQRPAQN
jgi:uncharacterized protein (TIGR03435 family)